MKRLLLALPAVLLLLVFLAGPLLLLVRVSTCADADGLGFYRPGTWSLSAYRSLLGERYFRSIWSFTLLLAMCVTGLTLLLAYPLALYIVVLPPRRKILALSAVIVPKLASALVILYGWKLLLSNAGPINGLFLGLGLVQEPLGLYPGLTGVIIAETYLLCPYAVVILVLGLWRMDPDLGQAVRGLCASQWQVFWRVTVPLSISSLAVAAQLCLVWAVAAFLGPMLMGGPDQSTLAVEVHRYTFEKASWPRGAAAAVLLLITVALCLALIAVPVRLLESREDQSR